VLLDLVSGAPVGPDHAQAGGRRPDEVNKPESDKE
jgi:hypothetical protein